MSRMLKVRNNDNCHQRRMPYGTNLKQYLFAEEIWYLFLHFWIKMSFLLFFLRLSRSKRFRTGVYCVMGANVFVTVGTWALYSLQCIPIEAYWYPERHPDVVCLPFSVSLWLPATAVSATSLSEECRD